MGSGSILVVGSIIMDQVVEVPRLPRMGETLLGVGAVRLVPGGKGANQAVAMARLGGSVRMAGCVGNDPFGGQLRTALAKDGVDTSLVVTDAEVASGTAFIFLAGGDNAIVVAAGANGRVGREEQQKQCIEAALKEAAALVLQLEIPLDLVCRLIESAYAIGVRTVLNLAPAQPLPLETLRKVSLLVVNESEAALLTGKQAASVEEAQQVARELHAEGIPMVVVTLGAHGAVLVNHDAQGHVGSIYQPSLPVPVVDTTAAGDCFVGAITVALNEGMFPAEALRFATRASALKVTRFGAQSGLPTREEVMARMGDE
jgi:ribokinase